MGGSGDGPIPEELLAAADVAAEGGVLDCWPLAAEVVRFGEEAEKLGNGVELAWLEVGQNQIEGIFLRAAAALAAGCIGAG